MRTIAFEDYISEDRKAEIAQAAFREYCEDTFRNDAERIFSNAAYKAVWEIVDDMFDGKAAKLVADKVPSIIESLTGYSVFRQSDIYGNGKSEAQKALDKAIQSNQSQIDEAVKKAAADIDRDYILDAVLDADFTISIKRN